mgnify:CR=1 FL=1
MDPDPLYRILILYTGSGSAILITGALGSCAQAGHVQKYQHVTNNKLQIGKV